MPGDPGKDFVQEVLGTPNKHPSPDPRDSPNLHASPEAGLLPDPRVRIIAPMP